MTEGTTASDSATVEDAKEIAAILASGKSAALDGGYAEWNPMESIPTLAVGKDILPGQVIAGIFLRTETLASPKFTNSNTRNEAGVPTQLRHVFRDAKTGKSFAIWNTGELKVVAEKLNEGESLRITYLERGVNAKGQKQHFFKFEKRSNA